MSDERRGNLGHWRDFVWQAVVNYRDTGAFAPSSRYLARLISDHSSLDDGVRVVEVGPGTGVFTEELLRRLGGPERLVVVEKSARFAALLRDRFPRLLVCEGCATGLPQMLQRTPLGGVDRVVSGLPWASMPPDLQESLLEKIRQILGPGGIFTTFAYFGPHRLPAGRSFRQRLERIFPEVSRTRLEWRNLPPAFVYRASLPEEAKFSN
jgi:phosphatidylethanolamine/phosphatidyl-N-methylethanolamine N-methyltransferase